MPSQQAQVVCLGCVESYNYMSVLERTWMRVWEYDEMCLDSIYERLYVQHMVALKSSSPLSSLPKIPACSRKKKVKKG